MERKRKENRIVIETFPWSLYATGSAAMVH